MYDRYDLLLVSIPTIMLAGIMFDRLHDGLHQIPLITSGIISMFLIFYALLVLQIKSN